MSACAVQYCPFAEERQVYPNGVRSQKNIILRNLSRLRSAKAAMVREGLVQAVEPGTKFKV